MTQTMKALDAYLAACSYLGSDSCATLIDFKWCHSIDVASLSADEFPHLLRWHRHVSRLMAASSEFDRRGDPVPDGSEPDLGAKLACDTAGGKSSKATAGEAVKAQAMPKGKGGKSFMAVEALPRPIGSQVEISSRLPRVLCLHGSVQSGKIFQDRLKNLLKKADKYARFVFIDAPHFQFVDHEGEKRCWWRAGERPGEPHPEWGMQWQQSRDVIESHLESASQKGDPFHGIMGFSNGAAVAAMVMAVASNVGETNGAAAGQCYSSLRFGMFFSGYRPDALRDVMPLAGYASLHMVGDSDPSITKEQTASLVGLFSNPPPLRHDMPNVKHHVPSRAQDTSVVCQFLQSQCV
mmetsp:Transcript_120819/g.219672  ORF Transcript_120819/g.219672 Transcript_120819/m.219672 type:complete len:351 (+) Transcript_120819:80-1132(+)